MGSTETLQSSVDSLQRGSSRARQVPEKPQHRQPRVYSCSTIHATPREPVDLFDSGQSGLVALFVTSACPLPCTTMRPSGSRSCTLLASTMNYPTMQRRVLHLHDMFWSSIHSRWSLNPRLIDLTPTSTQYDEFRPLPRT